MSSNYGKTVLTATGRYPINVDKNGPGDNIGVLQLGSGTWTATATIQINPFTAAEDPDGTGWQNVASVRLDTMALESAPTTTANTARSWKTDVQSAARYALNVTAITGSLPFNLQTYYEESGLGFTQTSTISATVGTLSVSTAANPAADDGAALGTTALGWADLFLATGGVINWANGEVTITETSANILTFAGASTGYKFADGPILPNADDGVAIGSAALRWSDLFLAEGGVINWDNGDVTITQTNNVLAVAGTTSTTFDGQVNPATNDAASLGTTALGWSDLHLATGGVINFANGEVTITETDANTLTVGGTTLVAFGATTINVTGTRLVTSYHTNIVSTNAVTVDSSETMKRDIVPYEGDALGVIRGIRVATYRHNDHLDSGRTKLGLISESVSEPLAVDQIDREGGGSYPGINTYGLAAVQTRAIQQLADEVERLKGQRLSA